MRNILYLVIVIFLISCANTNSQIIQNIGVSEFQLLINKEEAIIIDVRTPQEFHSGHIKDATNIDFYEVDFIDKLKMVRKDLPVFVYCRSGGRSSSSARKMEELGFNQVYNLVGGIEAWNTANYATTKSNESKRFAEPTFAISEVYTILKNNDVVLIDFSTEWCVPCKKMKPIIQQIQEENPHTKVLFIDADVNKKIIKEYKIQAVPVFIVFKNSKEIFRHVGLISKEELLKHLAD